MGSCLREAGEPSYVYMIYIDLYIYICFYLYLNAYVWFLCVYIYIEILKSFQFEHSTEYLCLLDVFQNKALNTGNIIVTTRFTTILALNQGTCMTPISTNTVLWITFRIEQGAVGPQLPAWRSRHCNPYWSSGISYPFLSTYHLVETLSLSTFYFTSILLHFENRSLAMQTQTTLDNQPCPGQLKSHFRQDHGCCTICSQSCCL